MTKNVITCEPDTPLKEAARLMYLNGLTGLPVLDAQDKLVGIITERNLVKLESPIHVPSILGFLGAFIYLDNPLNGDEIEKQLQAITAAKVGEVMNRDAFSVSPDTAIEELAQIFLKKNANPLPVVKDGKLVGVVSLADIVKILAGEKELAQSEWKELAKTNNK